MGRRSLNFIGILLFCLLAAACTGKTKDQVSDRKEISGLQTDSEHTLKSNQDISAEEGKTFAAKDDIRQEDKEVLLKNDSQDGINTEEQTLASAESTVRIFNDPPGEEEVGLSMNQEVISVDILTAYTAVEDLVEAMRTYPAGTIMNTDGAEAALLNRLFYGEELTQEVKDRINGKSYGENCDVPYEELRYIRVLHRDFDGNTRIGEIIINAAIAQDILDIFRELYELEYPIERMLLVDEYDAEDESSMEDNNTSAFNYRTVAGTARLSKHSLGLAIDINPLYNPYVTRMDGEEVILPESGSDYADRTKNCPYYIRKGDSCYEAFVSRGFTWGGAWKSSKDYQHFQKIIE